MSVGLHRGMPLVADIRAFVAGSGPLSAPLAAFLA